MKQVWLSFFKVFLPVNRLTVSGMVLLVLGFLLLPFLIGLPIAVVGAALLGGGIFWHFLGFFPKGKLIKEYLLATGRKYWDALLKLFSSLFSFPFCLFQ